MWTSTMFDFGFVWAVDCGMSYVGAEVDAGGSPSGQEEPLCECERYSTKT
jgi:hypothetical protein